MPEATHPAFTDSQGNLYRWDNDAKDYVAAAGGGGGGGTYPPYAGALVYKTADQAIPNATFTFVTFDAEDHDTDGFHDNATNNTRLTVPVGQAGRYRVWASAVWATTTTASQFQQVLRVDGPVRSPATIVTASGPAPNGNHRQVAYPSIELAEGDYMEFLVYQNTGGSHVLTGGVVGQTSFNMVRIS